MLNEELVELLNSGEAWVFLGAGVAAAAGLPDWGQLLIAAINRMEPGDRTSLAADAAYKQAYEGKRFPEAFSAIARITGRPWLVGVVSEITLQTVNPGSVVRMVAEWPVRGYITTNYDTLLEQALTSAGAPGFVSLANDAESLQQLSGNPRDVVWHLHGSARTPESLVLCEGDYDALYDPKSSALDVLNGLLLTRRVVFVGFSFQDQEVSRLYRHLKPLLSRDRPSLAIMDTESAAKAGLEQRMLLRPITYANSDGTHSDLKPLLSTQATMVVPRQVAMAVGPINVQPWDPMAANLLLYNELLKRREPEQGVADTLNRAVVLATLAQGERHSLQQLQNSIDHFAHAGIVRDRATSQALVRALKGLEHRGFVVVTQLADREEFEISDNGANLFAENHGQARLVQGRFLASVVERFETEGKGLGVDAKELAGTVHDFLHSVLELYAIGLALAVAPMVNAAHRAINVRRLLTDLQPIAKTMTPQIGGLLMRVVSRVLSEPRDAEREFIGLSLQGHFGLQLLGAAPGLLDARVEALRGTLLIADSSFLIDLLAEAAPGNQAARQVVTSAREFEIELGTTTALVQELVEHVNWAVDYVANHPDQSSELLDWYLGYGNSGSTNGFLRGYANARGGANPPATFDRYLSGIFGRLIARQRVSVAAAWRALAAAGIRTLTAELTSPADRTRLTERRRVLSERITLARQDLGTYRHARQVDTEVEVACIIEARQAKAPAQRTVFLTDSPVISRVLEDGHATLAPAGALHLLATLAPIPTDDVGRLSDALMSSLAHEGMQLISEATLLRGFSPLVTAAKEERTRLLSEYRDLLLEECGQEIVESLEMAPDVELPSRISALLGAGLEGLKKQLDDTRARLAESTARLHTLEKGQAKAALIVAMTMDKQAKGQRRERRIASRPRKKKKKT